MLRSGFFLFIALIISLPASARQSCEWPFRTEINVQENSVSGSQLQSYQVKFDINASTLHSDYDWSNNGEDLYIFDSNDQTLLEFWIDDWDSSRKEATIWVRFPTLDRGQIRTIYFYYGNRNAPPLANVPFTFNYPGIKFHTRFSTSNPGNLSQARNAFDNSNDRNSDYGCGFITNFDGITNRSQFGNGSSNNSNFAAFSESYFLVRPGETGFWDFRYGADFGRGGALYVDGNTLEQQWRDDLWWANSWNSASEILQGRINLNGGYHKLEVLGFEGCCDGGITVQFRKPGGNWTTFSTSNIDIRSRACPVEREPTFTVVSHDVCRIDLGFDNSLSYPNAWVVDDSRPVSFAIENLGTTHPSLPDTRVAITLGAGLSLSNSSGSNWNCSIKNSSSSSTTLECLYSLPINPNGARSTPITLNISSTNANTSASFSATVFSKQFEEQLVNNQTSVNLPVWELERSINPTCTIPSQGIFSRFYNTQFYNDNYADSEAQFNQWENDLAIRSRLDGKTILNQINTNSGNPFNVRNSDYYLALLEGYIEIPEDGFYGFAVDGDDAVELKLNGTVYSSWYGPHGAQNGPRDLNTVGLAKGFHKLDYRMQEYLGGDSFYAYWRRHNQSFTSIIPASVLFHCQGNVNIQLSLAIGIIDSPDTSGAEHKAIPGATLRYTLTGKNTSNISSSPNSVIITQEVSDDLKMYINGLGEGSLSSSPVAFIDGAGITKSGLSYGSLSFSNDNGSSYGYSPVDDGEGYDDNITNYKIMLNGSMLPKDNSVNPETIPSFQLIHQVKVK